MKISGNGQGKILTTDELSRLFADGFVRDRDRALFAICLFTGCRISEALGCRTTDSKAGTLTFRKSQTKGKLKTRIVDISPQLQPFLDGYKPKKEGWLFPGKRPGLPMTRYAADKIFRAACCRIGIEGASTHSFRRTALTLMSSAGVPLRVIQDISGHQSLGTLQRYLEVSQEQKKAAIQAIAF